MRGYYIYFGDKPSLNLRKKFDMQIEVFSKYYQIDEIDIPRLHNTTVQKILNKIPFVFIDKWNTDQAFEIMSDPDFVYVRRTYSDMQYISFFREIKERFPKCRIIVEIFTYPYYKDDYNTLNSIPFLLKEIWTSRYFKKDIDRFTTYSNDEELYGVKTIRMMNGVDLDKFRPNKPKPSDGVIRMIAMAMFQTHHGYERVIKGLSTYYKNGGSRKVELLMVGEGKEKTVYEKLAQECGLKEQVRFLGIKKGEELDDIFDRVDIALGSFGFYKKGNEWSSVLKIREYLAKGLPIVSGCTEDVFYNNPEDFYLHFPNDSSEVDICNITDFYDRLYPDEYESHIRLVERIRKFAEEHISMQATLKPVVQYINEGK